MRRLLIFGIDGQVGWELQRSLACLGEVIGCRRADVDLTDEAAIRRLIRKTDPSLIVNAAAYTAVDRAEQEPELAYAVNGKAPGVIAEESAALRALFIHYSTDYVFNGESKIPYTEEAATAPLNVYGASKLAGEKAIAATQSDAIILRTSWVYGIRGHNFLKTMLRLGRERPELRIVNDQIGAPTWSRMIAEATANIFVRWLQASTEERLVLKGLYHLTAGGETTWYGFAKQILLSDLLKQKQLVETPPRLEPILTKDYPLPAKRPHYSVLSNAKFMKIFGWQMPAWENSLKLCLEELNLGNVPSII